MKNRILTTLLIFSFSLFSLPILPNALLLGFPVEARGTSKLSPSLAAQANGNGNERSSVIVLTYNTPSSALKGQLAQMGGNTKREFQSIKGLSADLPASALNGLAQLPEVKAIVPDRNMVPSNDITRVTVGADVAQTSYGLDGSGIGVAVIDSGISPHSDLSGHGANSRIVYSECFIAGEHATSDLYGHGEHVAGIIAGNGAASMGYGSYRSLKGIAPNANLINLRVLNAQGNGQESDAIAAIERAIALKTTYNIRVINLSLGAPVLTSYLSDPLCQAVDQAWNAGIVVVVAAGNLGTTPYGNYGFITSPGNSPNVITVGATNSMGTTYQYDDKIASYSSRGPTLFDHIVKPDIVAPGNRIKSLLGYGSTLARTYAGNDVNPSYYTTNSTTKNIAYFTLSGTSMAAPVVSGAAALMLQKDPTLNNHTVKMRLMASANKVAFSQPYDILTVGAGRLDIAAALVNTGTATSSKSPYVIRDPNNQQLLLIIDAGWGTQQQWAAGIIWGGGVIWGSDSGIIWGSDNGIIWGSGVIWGSSSPFSDPSFLNSDGLRGISISGDGD